MGAGYPWLGTSECQEASENPSRVNRGMLEMKMAMALGAHLRVRGEADPGTPMTLRRGWAVLGTRKDLCTEGSGREAWHHWDVGRNNDLHVGVVLS